MTCPTLYGSWLAVEHDSNLHSQDSRAQKLNHYSILPSQHCIYPLKFLQIILGIYLIRYFLKKKPLQLLLSYYRMQWTKTDCRLQKPLCCSPSLHLPSSFASPRRGFLADQNVCLFPSVSPWLSGLSSNFCLPFLASPPGVLFSPPSFDPMFQVPLLIHKPFPLNNNLIPLLSLINRPSKLSFRFIVEEGWVRRLALCSPSLLCIR